MNGMTIKSTKDYYLISIEKNLLDTDVILEFMKRLSLETKIAQANFGKEILEIAEEIDQEWWTQNKEEFLKGIDDEDNS